jgi:ADP-heptose:LPS heptosyltransferase
MKQRILQFLEKWIRKTPKSSQEIPLRSIKRILIIRQHDQLGDFLLSTPVFRALRKRFPQAHLGLVVRTYTWPVALYNPNIDEVLIFPEKWKYFHIGRFLSFVKGLWKGWDLTIVLNTVSHSFSSDLIAFFSRARWVLGREDMIFSGCQSNFFYNILVPAPSPELHQSLINLKQVELLGISMDCLEEQLILTGHEQQQVRQVLKALGVFENQPLICVIPGAGKLENRWPLSKFSEFMNGMHQLHPKFQWIVSVGDQEIFLAQQLVTDLSFQIAILKHVSLRTLAGVYGKSMLCIGNDTGTLHVAAAVGSRVIGIFGPTDPQCWKPWGDRIVGIRAQDQKCSSVEVQCVLDASEDLLRQA